MLQNITKAIFMLTLIFNLTGSLVAAPFFKRLKLKNPGFEHREKIGGCVTAAYWLDYCNPKPFRLTRDAYHGVAAFKMKGRGFTCQRVDISHDGIGQPLTIHLYAKGVGELPFFFNLIGKNEEGKEFSTWDGWAGRTSSFSLTSEFMPYSFTLKKIPAKTVAVEVHFGSYSPVCAIFDKLKLFIGKPQKKKNKKLAAKIPANLKLVDIAPFAKIRTNPYGMLVKRMVDGIPHTGLTLEKHPSIKAKSYEFIYKQPQKIAKIRFTLPAKSFVLWADTKGNGKYDKRLTLEENFNALGYWIQKDWQWYEKSFWPPVRAKAIKLVTFKGNNAIFEFQIFSPQKYISKKFKELLLPVVDNKNIPLLINGKKIAVSEPKNQQRYLQGFHIEPWMYDSPGWLKKKPRSPLKDWPPFQKMVKELKRMHCNLVWLFPPKTWEVVKGRQGGGYPYDVMWPSKYFKWSSPENLLKEFTGEMHKAGIKVFVQWRFSNWKDIKLPTNVKEFPITGNNYPFIFGGVAEELIDAGVDGIPLCWDEAYFGSLIYPGNFAKKFDLTKAKDDTEKKKWVRENAINEATRDAFKKRWHSDKFPEKSKGSNYRKWVIFYYEQIAKAMKKIVETAKKKNPAIVTATNLVAYESFNNRMRWGVAYDIIANIANVDYLGTDPYHTMEDNNFSYLKSGATGKALSAGNLNTQSVVTLNFPWGWKGRDKQPLTYEVCPPISVMGSVVNSLMQGGTAFAFWRYNLSFFEGYDKYIEQVYGMLDTMAAWGAKEAKIPRNIAVLRSRASEDWWQLKVRSGDYKGNPGDEIQGYVYYKWLAELLMTNGYPFKLYYCDQPETLQKLSDFKLVILPFPYSISKGAGKEIEKAAANGTKVLILGKQGETDEIGDAYAKPLLKKMISSGKAKFVGEKIDKIGHFPEFTGKMLGKIDLLIGDRKTLTFDRCGSAVQVSCLEKSDTEKFIALINWGNSEASVKLGVNLPSENLKKPEKPEIKYQIFIRDLENTCKATINNNDVFSASDLKKFYVKLKKNEIKILYVTDK